MRISYSLLILLAATASQAGTLLGIDDARIYKIDATTGLSTSVGLLTGTGSAQANALAYNAATKMAYFQRGGKLWGMNVVTGVVSATGVKIDTTAAATFHKGAYYFMSASGGVLKKVVFTGLTAGPVTVVKDFPNSWGFGDVATDAKGKMYGSTGNTVFSIDLNSIPLTVTNESNKGVQTQLGFVGGTLYGIATGNASGGAKGQMFTFNGAAGMVSTGVVAKFNGSALALNDASSLTAVPGPAAMAPFALGALASLRRSRRKP